MLVIQAKLHFSDIEHTMYIQSAQLVSKTCEKIGISAILMKEIDELILQLRKTSGLGPDNGD